jgi:hypothetical protein
LDKPFDDTRGESGEDLARLARALLLCTTLDWARSLVERRLAPGCPSCGPRRSRSMVDLLSRCWNG